MAGHSEIHKIGFTCQPCSSNNLGLLQAFFSGVEGKWDQRITEGSTKKRNRLFKCLNVKYPVKSKTIINGVCNRKHVRLNLSQATEVTLRMDYLFRLAADPTE